MVIYLDWKRPLVVSVHSMSSGNKCVCSEFGHRIAFLICFAHDAWTHMIMYVFTCVMRGSCIAHCVKIVIHVIAIEHSTIQFHHTIIFFLVCLFSFTKSILFNQKFGIMGNMCDKLFYQRPPEQPEV